MTTGRTQVADYNNLFAKIYERAFLVARGMGQMAQLVTILDDSIGTEDRVFSNREQATAQSVAEGTDYQSPDRMGRTQTVTITPGEVMAQVKISKRALRQDPNVVADKGYELGAAMAEKIDRDLISCFTSLTGCGGSPMGTAGQPLTWGIILAMQARLKRAKAPGRLNVVLHDYAAFDLTSSLTLERNLASEPESVKNGLTEDMWLGRYQMMDFYVNQNIDADGSDDAIGAMFSPEALALDLRVAPEHEEPEYDASAREWEFNIYADYGYGVRRPEYGADVICDVTAPTGA